MSRFFKSFCGQYLLNPKQIIYVRKCIPTRSIKIATTQHPLLAGTNVNFYQKPDNMIVFSFADKKHLDNEYKRLTDILITSKN